MAERLTIRTATFVDVPALHELAKRAVYSMLDGHYDEAQLAAGRAAGLYRVEPELIEDGTYYLLTVDGMLAGCSGWTHRGTFIPNGPSSDRADTATMRATYVDPRWARRGLATLLARVTETAAAGAGFRRFEAMCTPPSEAMRRALGYQLVSRLDVPVHDGVSWSAALMRKELSARR